MDTLLEIFVSHKLEVFLFSLGIAFIFFYFVNVPLFGRKKEINNIDKYLKNYVDDDGNIVLEKLASVWLSAEKQNMYTKEEVSKLMNRVADISKREIVSRAESALSKIYSISELKSSEEVFNKLPAEEKIASLFGDEFLDNFIGEDISVEVRSKIAEGLWSYIESKENVKLSDFSKEEITSIVKELKSKLLGKDFVENSSVSIRASDIANKVAEELGVSSKEQEDKMSYPRELEIDASYESNLPDNVKNRLLEIGVSKELVDRVYIPKDKMLSLNIDFDSLWSDSVSKLIDFYNQLYLSGDLKYFVFSSYEPVKLFKDFLIYLITNYKPGLKNSVIPEGFSRVLDSAYFYNYLSVKNYKAFKKQLSENPQNFSFMSIIVAYNALYSKEYDEIYLDFVRKIINYINLKKEAVAYRHYILSDKEEFAGSYDHIGFIFNGDIYLIPKAIDIILGKYFIATSYLFKDSFDMHYLQGYFPHIGRYKLIFKEGREKIDLFVKVKRDSTFYFSLISNVKNLEISNSMYKNLKSIEVID